MVTRFLLLAGAAIAAPVAAQVANPVGTVAVPPSQPAPTPTPTPVPSPVVPAIAPPPIVTTVTPTPTPTASEEAPPPRRRRAVAPRPATRVAPVPTPSATPTAAPPVPIPLPTATPTPTPAPSSVPPDTTARGLPFWAVPAGLVALLLLGAALYAWRRRARDVPAEEIAYEPESPPVAPTLPLARDTAVPPPAAPPAAAPQFLEPVAPLGPRAALAVTLVPRRAGVNLLTATADVEITIVNEGDGPAADVRVGAQLTSAQPGQDDALGALFAAPIARPAAPPFALAPGETRTVRTLMTLTREAIVVLTAADRPMFVPVVAINVTYRREDGQPGQTAAAFAVGVEREGSAKLAPFWLDGASRMHDRLAARPHSLALRS